jgi:programmed cell death 6-interacting protein
MASAFLLGVYTKQSTTNVDIKAPLVAYVRSHYGNQAADDIADDLDTVIRIRSDIVLASQNRDKNENILATKDSLLKYYAALSAMETRFPIGDGGDQIPVEFTWFDAFEPTRRAELCSQPFEKAAIMFNIGAIQSQIALSYERSSQQGRVESKKAFEEAAGIFAHLRDTISLKIDPETRPVDLSPECCSMLELLFLAQAQECAWEHSVATQKSPKILCRLAAAAGEYYKEIANALDTPPLKDHFNRSWMAHATVKSLIYQVEATMQSSLDLRTSDMLKGVAREIARLRAAEKLIERAKKEAKNASDELRDNVKAKEAALAEQLTTAEKDNNAVYLQKVPPVADLPSIEPFIAVKPVSPVEMFKKPPPQALVWFSSVVPDSSAKSLSKYTALADQLVREQNDKLANASDEARLRLREWELPEALYALDTNTSLFGAAAGVGGGISGGAALAAVPDAAIADIEFVQSSGGIEHLKDLTHRMTEIRGECAAELDKAEQQLDQESAEDDQLRQHYGHRWRPAPSAQLTRIFRNEIAAYRTNLADAFKTDAANEKKLAGLIASTDGGYGRLDLESAAAAMPPLQPPMLTTEDDMSMGPAAAVATLKRGLEGQDALASQRAALEDELRQKRARDDILPHLLAAPQDLDLDHLFQTELKKYDSLVADINSNVSKQMQLLDVLKINQAVFKQAYSYNDWKRKCAEASLAIRAKVDIYRQLLEVFTEGYEDFYMTLQDRVTELSRKVNDFCITRRIDRDETVEDLRKQAEAADRLQQQLASSNLRSSSTDTTTSRGGGGGVGGHYSHIPQQGGSGYPSPLPPPQPPTSYGYDRPPIGGVGGHYNYNGGGGGYGNNQSPLPPPPPPPSSSIPPPPPGQYPPSYYLSGYTSTNNGPPPRSNNNNNNNAGMFWGGGR